MRRMFPAALLLGSGHSPDTTRVSHRMVLGSVVAVMLAVTAAAQTPPPKPIPPAAARPAASSGVDTVVALVKGGMSEALVIKTLKREATASSLSAADLLKLQTRRASENRTEAM